MTPETALQRVVIARLRALTAAAVPAGLVFDEVPADGLPKARDYLFVGPILTLPVDRGEAPGRWCQTMWQVRMTLFAASPEFGTVRAWELAHQARAALHRYAPALTEPYQLQDEIRVERAADIKDPLEPKLVALTLAATVIDPTPSP